MIAAAMTGGDVIIENVLPEHQKPLIAKLREAGALVEEDIDRIHVVGSGRLKAVDIKTLPYPGFPTGYAGTDDGHAFRCGRAQQNYRNCF